MVEGGGLRLLACSALAVLLISLVVLQSGPSESSETLSWLLAFAVALPAGFVLATRQQRALAPAAPAAATRGLAGGLALLAYGLLLRRGGSGDDLHHLILVLAAAGALAAPFVAAREWRDASDRSATGARVLALVSLAVLALLFVPSSALRPGALLPALAIAALALALLHARSSWRPPAQMKDALDAAACVLVALLVIQLPDIQAYAQNLIHHHGFFLGPANDVLHGREMLSEAWSQYGVGSINALALAFRLIPVGYGGLSLIVVALTTAQYLCVYGTLRLAGLGQLLAALTVAVAVLGNLFYPIEVYVTFPSATALRFGLPYLMILCAVLGARDPGRLKLMRRLIVAVLAIAAVWSFEAWVYCGVTYGSLVLIETLGAGTGVIRRAVRGAAAGLAASAAAIAVFSLFTLLVSGRVDWGPYLEYLRLYTSDEFGQLPVVFFSAGPLMAAAIFLSAATLLWLVREQPQAIAPSMRIAIAGFTGLAVATFTYYLGRSHPNNLLVLLVPVVALGGLWMQLALSAAPSRRRAAVTAPLALAAAMIAVASWPSSKQTWGDTALGMVVGGGSLRTGFERLAENPVLDPRAPGAAALLAEHLPQGAPAAVLTEPELTTEILLRAERRNLLPISNPNEDALIESSAGIVRAVSEELPAGTLLLTSPAPSRSGLFSPIGQSRDFNGLQLLALSVLRRRFEFEPVVQTPDGLALVRLTPRAGAKRQPIASGSIP